MFIQFIVLFTVDSVTVIGTQNVHASSVLGLSCCCNNTNRAYSILFCCLHLQQTNVAKMQKHTLSDASKRTETIVEFSRHHTGICTELPSGKTCCPTSAGDNYMLKLTRLEQSINTFEVLY